MDIEIRVDFEVWHSPIQQLNLHEYMPHSVESEGGHTRLSGQSPGQHLVGKRAMCIGRFHWNIWARRLAPAFQKRGWNSSPEQQESHRVGDRV